MNSGGWFCGFGSQVTGCWSDGSTPTLDSLFVFFANSETQHKSAKRCPPDRTWGAIFCYANFSKSLDLGFKKF